MHQPKCLVKQKWIHKIHQCYQFVTKHPTRNPKSRNVITSSHQNFDQYNYFHTETRKLEKRWTADAVIIFHENRIAMVMRSEKVFAFWKLTVVKSGWTLFPTNRIQIKSPHFLTIQLNSLVVYLVISWLTIQHWKLPIDKKIFQLLIRQY